MKGRFGIAGRILVAAALSVLAGCREIPPVMPVPIERDFEAVSVRFHNRTGVGLVLKPYVRQRAEAIPLGGSYSLAPVDLSVPDNGKPDFELPVFKYLPIKLEDVAAYSIDVTSGESEARVAIVDLTRDEMNAAKVGGRLTLVFRPNEITVVIGTTTKTVPWVRPLTAGNAQTTADSTGRPKS